ncbi:serine hydrolase domain-containing protein [Curtobacterium sp. NPDC087080]|uniref:serine hydrolase domain-containing protein n=1 Tax=Curtobacterium sp. NPDC087080 TaxID=3363965 RepID=UPI003808AA5D
MEKRAAYESVLPYVREWIDYKVWQLRLPGVQVAIGFEDEVLFSEAWGWADVEAGRRLTTTDLFRIASHSKTFTATALLQLADAGALRLDDTVGSFVPALVEAGSPIADATVRELMEMGAGVVRDGADGDHWALDHPFPDADQLVALVVEGGAKVPVGSAFNYSNLGYGLLGLVVEAVTGTSYAEHVRRAIVEPLGLTGTGPEYDPAREDEFVVGYTGLHTARTRQRVPHVTTGALAAATGFHGTASDLVRYFSAHVPGRGSLLSDHAKRLAQRKAWSALDTDPAARGYGAGFIVDRIGGREVRGHSGGFPGQITQTVFDPASSLVVSVLTSSATGPAGMLATGIVHLLDAAADEQAPGPELPEGVDTDRYTGRFTTFEGITDVARVGDRLLAIDPTQPVPTESPVRLRVVDEDTLVMAAGNRFGSVDERITYARDEDGTVVSFRGDSGMTHRPWSVPEESPEVAAALV